LIELLVVIAIIGILAAMFFTVSGKVTKSRVNSRMKAELAQLETAIESYKEKNGFYPPGNPNNVAIHPLFYELTGTKFVPAENKYQTIDGREVITVSTMQTVFNVSTFANSDPETSKNYYKNIKPDAFVELKNVANQDVEILKAAATPPTVPAGQEIRSVDGKIVNPWRYNSFNPTNNPGKYDLWVEIRDGNKVQIIGNW